MTDCNTEHMIAQLEDEEKNGIQGETAQELIFTDLQTLPGMAEKPKMAEDTVVEKMNKKHAVVHIDQSWILTQKKDPVFGGRDFVLESRQSFRNSYENKIIKCSDDKTRTWADVWLKSPLRREYEGIVFDPRKGENADGYYNIWTGFAVEPQKGDCSKFWFFVREVICAGDEKSYDYLKKWLAYVVQRPDEVHTAIVLCGGEGIGKNTFVETFGGLWGKHYKQLAAMREALSKFNYHHKDAVVISISEAKWADGRDDEGVLKAMVTDPIFVIEGKGKDQLIVKNFRHFIFSSNNSRPVSVEHDDRRFFYLNVSENRKGDQGFFADIRTERAGNGLKALLYDLLNEDLSSFNPRIMPDTLSSFDAKIEGFSAVEKYVFEILKEGRIDAGNAAPQGIWPTKIITSNFYQDFTTWCSNNHIILIDRISFIKGVKKIFKTMIKHRGGPTNNREYEYILPSINEARTAFQKYCNLSDGRCWEN